MTIIYCHSLMRIIKYKTLRRATKLDRVVEAALITFTSLTQASYEGKRIFHMFGYKTKSLPTGSSLIKI